MPHADVQYFPRTPAGRGDLDWGHPHRREQFATTGMRALGGKAILGTQQHRISLGATGFRPELPRRHVEPDRVIGHVVNKENVALAGRWPGEPADGFPTAPADPFGTETEAEHPDPETVRDTEE